MVVMVIQVDVTELRADLQQVGLGLVLAGIVHAVVLLLDAVSLLLCTRQPVETRLLARTYRAQLAGHAINVTTPGGSLGEVARYLLLADRIPREELAAAILVQNVLWFETNCLFIVPVAGLAPTLLDLEGPVATWLHIVAAVLLVAGVAVPLVLRTGPWHWPFRLASRLGLGPARAEAARLFTERMAGEMRTWSRDRRRARHAVLTLLVSRLGSALEVWVLLVFLERSIHPAVPFLALANSQVVRWLTLFVPFEAGTAEGGGYLLFGAIGLAPALGVAVELLKKAIRLVFVAVGVTMLGWHAFRSARTGDHRT